MTTSAIEVARDLIGYELLFRDEKGERGGIITETEAYTRNDPASHSYMGQTLRNAAMFMPAGTIYVYKIYGIHYCLNFVCGKSDGQAVLIRALKPTLNIELMKSNRGISNEKHLCDGPAKLVQALGLPADLNQKHIDRCNIILRPPATAPHIRATTRVGISKAIDKPWRFVLASY